MRSGPSRLTAPSVRVARPYAAPTSATSREPDVRARRRRGRKALRGSNASAIRSRSAAGARAAPAGPGTRRAPPCERRRAARPCRRREPLLLLGDELGEGGAKGVQKVPLQSREARVVEPLRAARAQLNAVELLVQVLARPAREAGIDRRFPNANTRFVTAPAEVITTTITTCGCSRSTST